MNARPSAGHSPHSSVKTAAKRKAPTASENLNPELAEARSTAAPGVDQANARGIRSHRAATTLAIAIAMERQRPTGSVYASDVRIDALHVARVNALRLGSYNVAFVQSDLFAAFAGRRFDVVTANPPYIPTADLATLMPDVRDHEPRLALDGGDDGLDLVRRIAEGAPPCLEPDGLLAVEIGAGEASATVAIFEGHGFRDVRVHRDIARIERVVSAVRRA